MDVKKIVLLVGALVIAAVTAVMAKNMFAGAGAEQAQAAAARRRFRPDRRCWCARKALPVGTIIDAEASPSSPGRRTDPERLLYGRRSRTPNRQAARHRRPQPDHRRPAGHPRRARRPERSRLPRRGARPGHARRHRSGVNATTGVAGFVFPGDRVDLVLTQEVAGGGDGPRAQGLRDDHPQHPRARHRPAHRQQGRGRQDRGQDLLHRDVRGDAADRREDRGRADHRPAVAVAALDRRQ